MEVEVNLGTGNLDTESHGVMEVMMRSRMKEDPLSLVVSSSEMIRMCLSSLASAGFHQNKPITTDAKKSIG